MLTLLVACSLTILAVEVPSTENPPNAALERQPVMWFVLYLSAALLLMVTVTCASCRERVGSKGPVGMDLVERGVLRGEKSGGLCEWLSRRWPWSPAPQRTPQLSHLRMGLARSTQPLLCYQLIEKRHVHLTRGALCVIRMDLEELQELAEKEMLTKPSRGSTYSGDMAQRTSYDTQRGSGTASPTERLGSVIGSPIVQLGTVKPVESSDQPLFRTVKPLGSSNHHVTWSPSVQNFTPDEEFLEEDEVGEPLPEDISTDSVVTTSDDSAQISDTNLAFDVKDIEKWGTEGEPTRLGETADTGRRDESQPLVTAKEEITQASDHVTPFKNVEKAKSYIDINREEGRKPEPTISLEGTQAKRDLLSLHKVQSAADLEQSSESDVLTEISGSSEEYPTYLSSHEQSQEHDGMLLDNTELDREIKTFRYISSATGDPESSPSDKEELPAIENTIKKSSSLYMCVLNKDEPKLHKQTLPTEVMEDSDVSTSASTCFLHPVVPQPQQERFQFNKHNSSKSVQYISLPSEKESSGQYLQYWQQTEYKVAPASVITANSTAFSASNTPTKQQNVKSSEKNISAEEIPGLLTTWDLLYSFPCHTDSVQMLRMDTTSKVNPVSESYNGLKQHDEHSLYQRREGDEVLATKQQESSHMEGIISNSRHKCSRADQHTSTVQQPPSSFRPVYTPVSYSETTTEQQRRPLTTTSKAGEHHKVLQWRITVSPHLANRITVSPHLANSNKRQTKNSKPEAE